MKYSRKLAALARRYGCSLQKTPGGHYRIQGAGMPPVFAAATPSDVRAIKNTEALLKRYKRRNADGQ